MSLSKILQNPEGIWHSLSARNRFLLTILLGAISVLAMPPFFFLPAIVPAFVVLIWSLKTATSLKSAFWTGWAWGFGFFVAGLYWLGHAIAVDLATFWWVLPFALFGFQACLAVFYGLAFSAAFYLKKRLDLQGWPILVSLTLMWLIADGLRSTILTGFPWNLLGTAWMVTDATMQPAAWLGVDFLTAMAILWAGSLGFCSRKAWKVPLAVFLAIPLVLLAAGQARIAWNQDFAEAQVENVRLRLVQANIPQDLKWDPEIERQNYQRHIDLTLQPNPSSQAITHVIWPETAVFFPLNRFEEARRDLASRVVPKDGLLLTGSNRIVGEGADLQAWNHLNVINQMGEAVAGYDKHHLVPFGEFMPFESLISSFRLVEGAVSFSRGQGPQTLNLPGLPPVAPMICYEGIFSGNVTNPASRPSWLLSVTNDGWFGLSTGPHQHLAATQLRAVEEGIPLVRVSNPGVSVVTNALGQILARTELGEATILDSALPVALPKPTVFQRLGFWRFWILLGALSAILAYWRLSRKQSAV